MAITNNPLRECSEIGKVMARLLQSSGPDEARDIFSAAAQEFETVRKRYVTVVDRDYELASAAFPQLNGDADALFKAVEETEEGVMDAIAEKLEELATLIEQASGRASLVRLLPITELLEVVARSATEDLFISAVAVQGLPLSLLAQLDTLVLHEQADPTTHMPPAEAQLTDQTCHCPTCVISRFMLDALQYRANKHPQSSRERAVVEQLTEMWRKSEVKARAMMARAN